MAPKAIPQWILLFLLGLASVTSCTVQKRLYTKGYSVEWHTKFGTADHEEKTTAAAEMGQQISPVSDTVTDEYPQTIAVPHKEVKSENNPLQIQRTDVENTRISKENHLPHHEVVHPLPTSDEKPPKLSNPPNENLRYEAGNDVSFAFELVEYATYALLGTLLFYGLASIVPASIVFLQYLFLFILILGIAAVSTFVSYILATLFLALCYMIVYWIQKLNYNRRKRIYDKWMDEHPSANS